MLGINKEEWSAAADDLYYGREMRLKAKKLIELMERKNKSNHALLSLLPELDLERIELSGKISGINEAILLIADEFDVDNEYYK